MSTVKTGRRREIRSGGPLLIIGAGAAGLCAALAAKEVGVDAVIDRTRSRCRRDRRRCRPVSSPPQARVSSAPRASQIVRRYSPPTSSARRTTRPTRVVADAVAKGSGATIEWLAARYGFPFDVVDNFNYPCHSALRMHGLPSRTGRELIDRLRNAAEENEVVILTERVAESLLAEPDGTIRGVEIVRGDGTHECIGCTALILACNGYGGNAELVRRFIPEMADALYFGHPGNRGDAVMWGDALGAQLADMSGYQGHGSVATPHNILISWAVIMQGGIRSTAMAVASAMNRKAIRSRPRRCCASPMDWRGTCLTRALPRWHGSSRTSNRPNAPARF